MELSAEEIQERVQDTEDKRSGYVQLATHWQKMWELKAFEESEEQARKEGRRQVVDPTPYNIVNLMQRLLSNHPSVDVPVEAVTEGKDEAALNRKRFLSALLRRSSRELRMDVVKAAAWMGAVRGRFVLDTRWVWHQLPERLRRRRMPCLIRPLDPLNCGFRNTSLGPLWAYHKYEAEKLEIRQRWPEADLYELEPKHPTNRTHGESDKIEIVDFWYYGNEGAVWNAVLASAGRDGSKRTFLKDPVRTNYPDLPMVEGVCDGAPIADETYRGLSLMHNIDGIWQKKCLLLSQVMTGMDWYFWPFFLVKNPMGYEVPDFEVGPGKTQHVPAETQVEPVAPAPNIPLAEILLQLFENSIQQSSFPGVMYGEAPGSLQAGYGISLLSDAAKGRINSLREQLEWALEVSFENALGLVQELAPPEGIAIWGYDERLDQVQHIQITPKDVSGYLENKVNILPNLPSDDLQRRSMGMNEVREGLISKRTYRQNYAGALPDDEELRIMVEQIQGSELLQQAQIVEAAEVYWGPDHEYTQRIKQMMGVGLQGQPQGQPQQGGPPPPNAPMQGQMAVPGGKAGMPAPPPNVQGGMMNPEMMGLPANMSPEQWQMLMGGGVPPVPPPPGSDGGPAGD